jgi:arsenate reductase
MLLAQKNRDNVMMQIYHNPRCSKSRQTLALIEQAGKAAEIILYLETPPERDEIVALAKALGCGPRDMMRRGEAPYKDLDLANADDAALFDAMAAHPILIERPIVVRGQKAIIGRPPERVQELF